MKIIEQSFEWVVHPPKNILQIIEKCARTCYKSEDKIDDGSAEKMIKSLIKKDHQAMIEFGVDPIVNIVTDRGITHELVRHRPCSYAQESTRYVNYQGQDMQFIKPVWYDESTPTQQRLWVEACRNSELSYNDMIRCGWSAQKARTVLNNSIKTEINIKCNLREWRHIFSLRCSNKAHPQIQEIMKAVLAEFYVKIPIIFDDIADKYFTEETLVLLDIESDEYFNG